MKVDPTLRAARAHSHHESGPRLSRSAGARLPRPALRRTLVLLAIALLALPLAPGCGGGEAGRVDLTVFAAASLTDAFTALGEEFTAAHPDVTVVFSFAGSQELVAQLQQAAPADVLATADTKTMDTVADLTTPSEIFAGNKLAIAVAAGNPEGITSLDDLAREDLTVVLAAPEVPAGKYAQEILDDAGVTVRPVSLEESVKGVVTKVSLGEADAGIVYVTDVAAALGEIDGVEIPEEMNVVATYPIAVVTASENADAARAFVDFILSGQGRQVLQGYGFLPPGPS